MTLNLNEEGRSVYIEITNPVHGGEGWDFGEVLWSPLKDRAGKDSWKLMRDIEPGDIIYHSLKAPGGHKIQGVSIAKSSYIVVDNEPPIPGAWAGHDSYMKVYLQNYSPFSTPVSLAAFLGEFKKELAEIGTFTSFFTSSFGVAQKYIAELPHPILTLLNDYIKLQGNDMFNDVQYKDDTDINVEGVAPARVVTTTTRVVRDTKIAKELKDEYRNRCQICGIKLKLPCGNYYSEGHHLKKLGGLHNGPDSKDNIMILCPNHHTEFDYGMITIEKDVIKHIDEHNNYHGKNLAYKRSDINNMYLKYHTQKIFNKK